jgi:WD40 repeat protein
VAFSPDSQVLVTASSDRTARLWSVERGHPIGAPLEHHGTVFAATFSPDGKLVATASHDKTARLWSAADGTPIGAPLRHRDWIWSIVFDLDGRRVLTGSGDGSARFWPVPQPMEGSVEQLSLWAQVVTGLELDAFHSVLVLDAHTWRVRRERLRTMASSAPPLSTR